MTPAGAEIENKPESSETALTKFRWVILALAVLATTINYVDRQIIALLKPMLEVQFGWSDLDYGHIVSGFQLSAALAYIGAGWFIDRVGLRFGYPIAVAVWSLTAMAHAAATSVAGFIMARVGLGISEAANTPAAIKTVAFWFPVRERALAVGFLNSGSNLGAILTPLLVPPIALAFGWQAAFIITGALGLFWVLAWLMLYRNPVAALPPTVVDQTESTAGEAPEAGKVPFGILLRDRRVWAIAGAKFISDTVWWFMLFWLPDFLHRVYKLDLASSALPLVTVYSMATIGALSAGLLPAYLLRRGVSLNAARKLTMLLCAIVVTPVAAILQIDNYWYAMLLVGLVLAAHQGFSTNVFALVTDMFRPQTVGTVAGIGALFGNLGGLAMLEFTGWVLHRTGSYLPMFMICASAYILALLLVHLLVPQVRAYGAANAVA
jgi:ACS family hexuronate transporter-like MFS transporter